MPVTGHIESESRSERTYPVELTVKELTYLRDLVEADNAALAFPGLLEKLS